MEAADYSKLIILDKDSNNNLLAIPAEGLQKNFKLRGKFTSKEKFDSTVCRTGHINKNKLTLILNSKSHVPMMRFDIIGTNHNDIPTPHLHIFNCGESIIDQTVLPKNQLPEQLKNCLNDLTNVVENFTSFLKFINVDLNGVQIITDFV
ncbi:MAG: hypothetical protein LKE77_08490 [Companilactobacillus sp.]|jgi:hypothetical protein|uniref:DUF6978 family protein n=1 Tax=Companilactobacillus sp. TaxID=2767905 RepID=UPI0025C4C68D|nr:hypothetical protein [Companilactobacillus sp.]MCH4010331.1 hypothetical protein [Companilactobacillus sp.]MCH4051993.1 hypothetical protein [Companilactobacillus sp.]MCH4075771.1 hypothetical protein [Companilactobacillus sp.]MCH4126849.1 hypothetical protein [Companilactobacillus sp.]